MDITHPYLRTAAQEIQNKEFDKAKNLLTSILNNNPYNPDAWYLLGVAFGEPHKTAYCLRRALSIQPNHTEAQEGVAQLERDLNIKPLQVMRTDPNSGAIGGTCPYCHNHFASSEEVVVCPVCSGVHHYACWADNGYACATRMCQGFSLREVALEPLPAQPPQAEQQVIVIREEDIPDVNVVTRKGQEEPFLRKLLVIKLMAEEGLLAPEQAAGLPDIDELLDQFQRDRKAHPDTIRQGEAAAGVISQASNLMRSPAAKFCIQCGKAYPREASQY